MTGRAMLPLTPSLSLTLSLTLPLSLALPLSLTLPLTPSLSTAAVLSQLMLRRGRPKLPATTLVNPRCTLPTATGVLIHGSEDPHRNGLRPAAVSFQLRRPSLRSGEGAGWVGELTADV